MIMNKIKNKELKKSSQYILLDYINDPGNLGTIIRSAEWFGFKQIICSKNSVERFYFDTIIAKVHCIKGINCVKRRH